MTDASPTAPSSKEGSLVAQSGILLHGNIVQSHFSFPSISTLKLHHSTLSFILTSQDCEL